jgi:hypothetical protein
VKKILILSLGLFCLSSSVNSASFIVKLDKSKDTGHIQISESIVQNKYDINGYDVNGYDATGYNINGLDSNGYDINGYDINGYNIYGLDSDGLDVDGLDSNGLTPEGCSYSSLVRVSLYKSVGKYMYSHPNFGSSGWIYPTNLTTGGYNYTIGNLAGSNATRNYYNICWTKI